MLVQTDEEETVGLKESFVIANVKQPLVAVGKWLKRGFGSSWQVVEERLEDSEQRRWARKHAGLRSQDDSTIVWRGNSLAFKFSTKILEINYVVKLKEELEEIAKEQGSWIMEDGTPVNANT